jgi:alkylation response protein AidB-like acyl-CoA dehydrogenase
MDLRDTPDEEKFRLELRAWLAENAPPKPHPERGTDEWHTFHRPWHKKLSEAGYAGLSWPVEYGGRGGSPSEQVIFEEELGRAGAPGLANHLGIFHIAPAIMTYGTEEQKKRYLPKILSAEEIWCQGFSEPGAGSDLASLRTRAVRDGDDFVVNGQKVWTTFGALADMCQLLVRTDPDAPKHRGISCLLVDMRTPGIDVRPLRQITGGSEFGEVFFTDARVPADALLGELNGGWQVTMTTLASERASVLTFHVRVQDKVRDLARLAREHGRENDPLIRQRIGACALDAHTLRLISYASATRAEQKTATGLEGSQAKLLWSELEQRIYETAAEILGPDAVLNSPWLHGLLDSRSLTIAAGTSEIQKTLLAERGLGLPREPWR